MRMSSAQSDSANLLPKHLLDRQQTRRWLRVWIRVAVVGCVLSGLCTYISVLANEQTLQTLAASQEAAREARSVVHVISQLKRDIQQLRRLTSEHTRLRSEHPPLALLGLLEKIRQSTGNQAQVQSLDFQDRAAAAEQPPAGKTGTRLVSKTIESQGLLRVRFIVPSAEMATQILNSLRDTVYFRDVTLDSPIEQDHGAKQFSFSVRCQF
jgi:hypothetical protein